MIRVLQTKIATGERLLAEDMLRLNFLPVGTILMYDGGGWADDSTIPGWVQCDGATKTVKKQGKEGEDGGTISVTPPNLKDKFICGWGSTAVGKTGGNNSMTLSVGNLPQHNHSITDPGHNHSFQGSNESGAPNPCNVASGEALESCWGKIDKNTTGISIGYSGSNAPFDNRPSYYALIYIRKCV